MDDRRLNKYLADSGFCSRREADRLIEEGKVTINRQVARIGERVALGDRVAVGNRVIQAKSDKIYIAAYKPVGIISTADPQEPMNIVSFINYPARIYPIGRLDKDSEGLILLTSDGDIVNRILRAAGRHEKEYEVVVDKPVTDEFLARMGKGVPVLGRMTLPCRVRKTGPRSFRIILVQGLNRQIRRMSEYLGYTVVGLRRLRVMNVTLGHMRPGQWRLLTQSELTAIKAALDQGDASRNAAKPAAGGGRSKGGR